MKHIFKFHYAFIIAVAFLSLSSCTKEDVSFPLTIPINNFTIPAQSTFNNWVVFKDEAVTTGIKQAIIDAGGDPANIKSIKLNKATLTFNSGATFNDIDIIEAYVKDESNKISFKTAIPATNLTSVSMDLQGTELVDFFQDDNVRFLVRGFNKAATPDINASASFELQIKVGPKK